MPGERNTGKPAELPATQKLDELGVPLGTKNDIELAILRRAEKTLGKIIPTSDSPARLIN